MVSFLPNKIINIMNCKKIAYPILAILIIGVLVLGFCTIQVPFFFFFFFFFDKMADNLFNMGLIYGFMIFLYGIIFAIGGLYLLIYSAVTKTKL